MFRYIAIVKLRTIILKIVYLIKKINAAKNKQIKLILNRNIRGGRLMKNTIILITMIGIFAFSACNTRTPGTKEITGTDSQPSFTFTPSSQANKTQLTNTETPTTSPITTATSTAAETSPSTEPSTTSSSNSLPQDPVGEVIYPPDLDSLLGIKNYLVGSWVFSDGYRSDVVCDMTIDESFNVQLEFFNPYENKPVGNYSGKIVFDHIYVDPDQAPDYLRIILNDDKVSGGEYYFLHRTNYDGVLVMGLFFGGTGSSVFDILGPEGLQETPKDIYFERYVNIPPSQEPKKDAQFHAVFWGMGDDHSSIWLDDVAWFDLEDDLPTDYPREIMQYQNEVYESALYPIPDDLYTEIMGDDLFPGAVYYVETNDHGEVIGLKDPMHAYFAHEGEDDELSEMLYFILTNGNSEVRGYLDAGMKMLVEGETITLDGEECYSVILGTDHAEKFTKEIFYAVDFSSEQVYRYDVLTDSWEKLIRDH